MLQQQMIQNLISYSENDPELTKKLLALLKREQGPGDDVSTLSSAVANNHCSMSTSKYNNHCSMSTSKYNNHCSMSTSKYSNHCSMSTSKYSNHCSMSTSNSLINAYIVL